MKEQVMTNRDYYEILGINKNADDASIKRAYRNLAMKYHPDRNPEDVQAMQKMREINEAYAVLSDHQKRQRYDTYGHAGLEGLTSDDIFGSIDFGSLFQEFGLGNFGFGFGGGIFDSFFGGRRTSTKERRKGHDLSQDLNVTLEEVALGAEKKIEITKARLCNSCKGTGAKANGLKSCHYCGGSGQIVREQRSGYSVLRQITSCSHCHGKGRIVKDSCDICHGKGFTEEVSEVTISIPKGANSGYGIKIEGGGETGSDDVIPGDLYIVLKVNKHPVFERHGDDIYMTKEISFSQAALGGEIEDIPGLYNTLKLEIPEGTQTGTVFRIDGEGMPRLNGYGKGDQYVMVKVVTPQNLTDKEKELLSELARLQTSKNKAKDGTN